MLTSPFSLGGRAEVSVFGNSFHNVLHYGADNSGVLDATSAIQRAVDAAEAAGGGVVYCPAGTYLVSNDGTASHGCIRLKDGVTLKGDGMGRTEFKLKNSTVYNVNGIIRSESGIANHDICMEDFTINGNKENQQLGGGIASITRSSSTVTLTTNSAHGITSGMVSSSYWVRLVNQDEPTSYLSDPTLNNRWKLTGVPTTTSMTWTVTVKSRTVVSLTSSGTTATCETETAHSLKTGDYAEISGATETEYNGVYVVTRTGTHTFTYTFAGSATTPATGTITAVTPISTYAAHPNALANLRIYPLQYICFFGRTSGNNVATTNKTVSSITKQSSTTARVVTSSAHGYSTGQKVFLRGSNEPAYNGQFEVTVIDSTTFDITIAYRDIVVSSITRSSSTVTVTTRDNHRLSTDDRITISGSGVSDYNTTTLIKVTDDKTFTFTIATTPANESPSTATVTTPETTASGSSKTSRIYQLSRSGSTCTCVTEDTHGLTTGDTVFIFDAEDEGLAAGDTGFNGEHIVTVTNSTTFTFTCTGTPSSPDEGRPIVYEQCGDDDFYDERITIRRIEGKNATYYGIDPHERVRDMLIEDCIATNNGADGFVCDFIEGAVIQNCISRSNKGIGFNSVTSSNNITYINCISEYNDEDGFAVTQSSDKRVYCTNHKYIGCDSRGNGAAGFRGSVSDEVHIIGGKFYENQTHGIRMRGIDTFTIMGTLCLDNGQLGNSRFQDINIEQATESPSGTTRGSKKGVISGNRCVATATNKVAYGYAEAADLSDYNTFTDNYVEGATNSLQWRVRGYHSRVSTPNGSIRTDEINGTTKTLDTKDVGKILYCNASAALTITVPAWSSLGITKAGEIVGYFVWATGASGQPSFSASGSTIISDSSYTKIATLGSMAVLVSGGSSNTYHLTGNLSA